MKIVNMPKTLAEWNEPYLVLSHGVEVETLAVLLESIRKAIADVTTVMFPVPPDSMNGEVEFIRLVDDRR